MQSGFRISSARLRAPAASIAALQRFYGELLGLPARSEADRLALRVGADSIQFVAAPGRERPFYHVAFLVPGNRYEAARTWMERHAPLLTRPGQTATTFRFDAWDADACYVHDPAGNIIELIAHRGVAEAPPPPGGFQATELVGISELGLVVDDPRAAAATLAAAGVPLWSGEVEGTDALAFLGAQEHTLILCAPGRPWLPTQRPAEGHAVSATLGLGANRTATVSVAGGTLTVGGASSPGS